MDPTIGDGLQHAAMVLLYRELERNPQVTLTQAEFEAFDQATDNGLAIMLTTNEDQDIILTHRKARDDA